MSTKFFDVVVIGGGICGISSARAIAKKYPQMKIGLLEKETALVRHQSNRNSQVLHAGMYYETGSNRAKLCRPGYNLWIDFCKDRNINVWNTGKLICGMTADDTPRLEELLRRAHTNGAPECEIISQKEAQKYAPRLNVADPNAKMLWSPATSTMNINKANVEMEKDIRDLDNLTLMMGQGVKHVVSNNRSGVDLHTIEGFHENFGLNYHFSAGTRIQAKAVINCAGNYSDKIAAKLGARLEYLNCLLKGYYCRTSLKNMEGDFPIPLLYPIPPEGCNNASLGSHTTIGNDGTEYVKIGPGAFPAFWRENYSGMSRANLPEILENIGAMAKMLTTENRKVFLEITLKQLTNQRIPGLARSIEGWFQFKGDEATHFDWYKPCMSNFLFTKDGQFVHDFKFVTHENSVSMLNYNSPGWTCALATGQHVADDLLPPILARQD
jgi:L-2-hydroxyglutarate oxidase